MVDDNAISVFSLGIWRYAVTIEVTNIGDATGAELQAVDSIIFNSYDTLVKAPNQASGTPWPSQSQDTRFTGLKIEAETNSPDKRQSRTRFWRCQQQGVHFIRECIAEASAFLESVLSIELQQRSLALDLG